MRRTVLIAMVLVLSSQASSGYVLYDGRPIWPNGFIDMKVQLGSPGNVLLDGRTSWTAIAEGALADWNDHLRNAQFTILRDAGLPIGGGDGRNSVFFADTVFGQSFGDALAVAPIIYQGSTMVEGDVVFNNERCWNSYRGPVQTSIDPTCPRRTRYDLRRVALHEFGHVLGLDHPDQYGQNVRSIMNSTSGDTESLQPDDIGGVALLYSGSGSPPPRPLTINFPPRNESLDFRNQLEAKYRDGLRRGSTSTFVDGEGAVVWMQEYLRYRVNLCQHVDAINRVFMQIDGLGIQPVCDTARSLQFPPRQESLSFGFDLENKYRDSLRRPGSATFVDLEGGAVWTQEYLRLRVTGCGHANATQSVFAQIDGTTPACR